MVTEGEGICSIPLLYVTQTDECAICGQIHSEESCTLFGKITEHVKDTPTPSYARLTLPEGIEVRDLSSGSKIVVATKPFRKGVKFGPFIAKTSVLMDVRIDFPLKVFLNDDESVYLESYEELFCNWMCLVPPASNQQEQNLLCYQVRTSIYFCTLNEIKEGEELRVWYSPYYAEKMGVDCFSKPTELAHSSDEEFWEIFTSLQTGADVQNHSYERKKKKKRISPRKPVFMGSSSQGHPPSELLPGELLGAKERRQEWQCKECGQMETNVAAYARHLMVHYRFPKRKSFSCPYCPKWFRKDGHNMKNHIEFCKLQKLMADKHAIDGVGASNEGSVNINESTSYEEVPCNKAASGSSKEIGLKSLNLQNILTDDDDCIWNSTNSSPTFSKNQNKYENDNLENQPKNKGWENKDSIENRSEMCGGGSQSLNIQIDGSQEIQDIEIGDITDKCIDWSNIGDVSESCDEQKIKPKDGKPFEPERNTGLESLDNLLPKSHLNPPILDLSDDIDFNISNSLVEMISDHCDIDKSVPFPKSDRSLVSFKSVTESNLLTSGNPVPETSSLDTASLYPVEKSGFLQSSFTPCVDVTDEERNIIVENLLSETDDKFQASDYDITDVCVSDNIDSDWNVENRKEGERTKEDEKKKKSKRGGDFKCDICGKSFVKQLYLLRHLRKHTGEFRCNSCFMAFARKESLVSHRMSCPSEAVTQQAVSRLRILCPVCKLQFFSVESLDKHMEAHYCKAQTWKCSCGQSSNDSSLIVNHNCPLSGISVSCVNCRRKFKSLDDFVDHKNHIIFRRSALWKDASTVCELCGLTFKSRTGARLHRSNHGEKKFECSVCGKKFGRKDTMLEHLQRHETPTWDCQVCDKKLASQKLLQAHYRVMHSDTNFKCQYCNKEFRQKGNLVKHLKIHERNTQLTKCKSCDKSFATTKSYQNHIKTHENCPFFQCSLCEKVFSGPHQLKTHMRKSHNEMYRCAYCNAYFRYRHLLKKHLSCKHAELVSEWDSPEALTAMIQPPSEKEDLQLSKEKWLTVRNKAVNIACNPSDKDILQTAADSALEEGSVHSDHDGLGLVDDAPEEGLNLPLEVINNYQVIPQVPTSQPLTPRIDLNIDEPVQDDTSFVTNFNNTVINVPFTLPKGYQLSFNKDMEEQVTEDNTALTNIGNVEEDTSTFVLTDPSTAQPSQLPENYMLLYIIDTSVTNMLA